MRRLSKLIVLVRGGGEVGSAIAHRLHRSNFRLIITETSDPLDINRSTCFSEVVYESEKTIEDVTAERTMATLEQIYKVWRNDNIPVVIDPGLTVKPLVKPDVLINAMMLRRRTNTNMQDAPLVIGIGPGFIAGLDAHLVVDTTGKNLGKVIIEGACSDPIEKMSESMEAEKATVIWAEDAGVFITERKIGESINSGDILGSLNDIVITSPVSGLLRGVLRNDVKVLANTRLAEIDPLGNKSDSNLIRYEMRAIAGGVLEAILMSFNIDEAVQF
jgi:xanthine dehydrogenase accessory factor